MFPHLYRTYINSQGEGNLIELVIDLGFHVSVTRLVTTEEPIDPQLMYHRWLHVLVREPVATARREPYYRATLPEPPRIQLLLGAPGEPAIAARGQGPPELWRYPFGVIRVIDGDTFDARIDFGFGITTVQRIRLAGVQAPELSRAGRQEGNPGYQAYRYVKRRLADAQGRAQLISSRLGKWRRWIGVVFLPDNRHTLSEELLTEGLALPWDRHHPDPGPTRRMVVELPTATSVRLGEVSAAEGAAAGVVAGRILERHLDRDYPPAPPPDAAERTINQEDP